MVHCLGGDGATFAFEVLAVVQISSSVEGLLGTSYTSSQAVETLPFCPFCPFSINYQSDHCSIGHSLTLKPCSMFFHIPTIVYTFFWYRYSLQLSPIFYGISLHIRYPICDGFTPVPSPVIDRPSQCADRPADKQLWSTFFPRRPWHRTGKKSMLLCMPGWHASSNNLMNGGHWKRDIVHEWHLRTKHMAMSSNKMTMRNKEQGSYYFTMWIICQTNSCLTVYSIYI